MIGKRIEESRPLLLSEVLEVLEERDRNKEIKVFEQRFALDYLRKFSKLPLDKGRELLQELKSLGIDEWKAVKIVDILPGSQEELRTILMGDRIATDQGKLKEILELVEKYKS
ncbi:MAG TPA: DNA-directed RNA polymerase subunit F [Euryarchaeota archaeon]|nr:MAG: DNA-directed RNA polymerase subunit F [Thermococci archaeon]RLF97286.1 MAG: DNA-directed RNA polymerase subunit F [Thermococci archaeon]HDI10126.1 DNA-directed RNA polymerase subunit F [Euryarchaeota archaeon]